MTDISNKNAGNWKSDPLKSQHIIPCLLFQVQNICSNGGEACLYRKNLEYLEVVGKTINQSSTALRTEIKIQDHTGLLTVVFFKKHEDEVAKGMKLFGFCENNYVRIIISMRQIQDSLCPVGTFIENIQSRSIVNEHYSRVLLAYVKYNGGGRKDLKDDIIHAIKILNPNNSTKGVKIVDIKDFIGDSASLSDIEEKCETLRAEGCLRMGIDWNHYYFPL
ncbi:hypothetical protein SteCoe_14113 [Stentor coeruleus]|uniref:OB domain-containing protein n=1 Tax=Stentor coeruleus TaxID=5963 RepID=A0A1R2C6S5_9CILI|nr:hypothetical protein SteCoe_14113 [Stentor coeruleus]